MSYRAPAESDDGQSEEDQDQDQDVQSASEVDDGQRIGDRDADSSDRAAEEDDNQSDEHDEVNTSDRAPAELVDDQSADDQEADDDENQDEDDVQPAAQDEIDGEQDDDDDGQDDDGQDADGAACGCVNAYHGLIRDVPDARDYFFSPMDVPSANGGVDLRDQCPPMWNQGQMMSCTAFAVAAAFEFESMKLGNTSFSPSRLFIWYNARYLSGTQNEVLRNMGSQIRLAIRSLNDTKWGVCAENDWSYEVGKSDKNSYFIPKGKVKAAMPPPAKAYTAAKKHRAATTYLQIANNLQHMINCLDQGHPFIIGLHTYGKLSSPEVRQSGRLELPTREEKRHDPHDHSLLVVGYIPDEEQFMVRNSWGDDWGQGGYFVMPYKYVEENNSTYFWTLRLKASG